jgi:hypothetical protein
LKSSDEATRRQSESGAARFGLPEDAAERPRAADDADDLERRIRKIDERLPREEAPPRKEPHRHRVEGVAQRDERGVAERRREVLVAVELPRDQRRREEPRGEEPAA